MDGTLGLTPAANFAFGGTDRGGSRDSGDIDDVYPVLHRFETDATRGRWLRPLMELGVEGSLVFDTFTLTDSLVNFEVTRVDGTGLGWRSRRLESVEGLCTCDTTLGTWGDDGAVRDTPVAVGFGG